MSLPSCEWQDWWPDWIIQCRDGISLFLCATLGNASAVNRCKTMHVCVCVCVYLESIAVVDALQLTHSKTEAQRTCTAPCGPSWSHRVFFVLLSNFLLFASLVGLCFVPLSPFWVRSVLPRLALCWVVLCRCGLLFNPPLHQQQSRFFDVGDATPPPGTLLSHSPFNTTLQHHAPTLAHNPSHHSLTCTDPRATPTQPVANVGAGLKKEQESIYRVTSVGPKSPGMDATCKHSTAVDAQLSLTAWLTGRKMHCTVG
jgi:hypothetical protein